MPTPTSIYQIKVTLNDSKPPIWRRVLVEDTTTLSKLHTILQTVMGWTDSHLHQFIIDEGFYGNPDDDEFGDMDIKNEKRFHLNQFVERKGFKFIYEYDFGDSWEHTILVEAILPAEKGAQYPRCIEGKRACPPEDVGGVWGYEDFLKTISNPKDPGYEEMMEWTGEFDPERFNLDHVNEGLRHPRRRIMDEEDFYEPPQADGRNLMKIPVWAKELDKNQLAITVSLAVRRDMVTFLTYLKDNRPVGTQSTGNLPLKAVREICAKFVNPPALEEKIGNKVYKIRSEDDVYPLYYLHTLASMGGFVTGGQVRQWKLTSEGDDFLNAPAPMQHGFMFALWWYQTDWRIAFPFSGLDRGLPKDFSKITLKRLLELPIGKLISYEPFADQLIKETRFTWSSPDQTFVNSTLRSAIARMVIYPLANFAIMEYEHKEKTSNGYKSNYLAEIRLTSFGKGLLETL
ncbi:MAG: plasmid pRiA4b ORF-3 family protein [Anaerolineales bacterium]|nr:plasmid pRiA4b ORF-3 family protein [Anaerolineales bacterium]